MLPRNVSNNAVLSNKNASPMKSGIADNSSRFSNGRSMFANINNKKESQEVYLQKKWYGSTSSSLRTDKIRSQAIGKGSFNDAGTNNSFINTKDVNDSASALRRTRAGGYVVPPKVTNKMS